MGDKVFFGEKKLFSRFPLSIPVKNLKALVTENPLGDGQIIASAVRADTKP
ncbi:MAG: hypothetical protein IJS15_00110 [Victivallales bacterium]|nr:hypothetical protein [Victivallales bacterium]